MGLAGNARSASSCSAAGRPGRARASVRATANGVTIIESTARLLGAKEPRPTSASPPHCGATASTSFSPPACSACVQARSRSDHRTGSPGSAVTAFSSPSVVGLTDGLERKDDFTRAQRTSTQHPNLPRSLRRCNRPDACSSLNQNSTRASNRGAAMPTTRPSLVLWTSSGSPASASLGCPFCDDRFVWPTVGALPLLVHSGSVSKLATDQRDDRSATPPPATAEDLGPRL